MGKKDKSKPDFSGLPAYCEIQKTVFFNIWMQMIAAGSTHKDAYQILEDEHLRAFGVRKFKNYQAFRKARERRIRKKLARS